MKRLRLQYPIGKYNKLEQATESDLLFYIEEISLLPNLLREAVLPLNEEQLSTPYRPNGWTVRQVVHHLADSHINAYMRMKLALTEETPQIKPYFEDRWAELPDGRDAPVEVSLKLIEALHYRWAMLLKSLNRHEVKKEFFHPEHGDTMQIDECMGMYAWHGKHHLAHITELAKRKGW